MERSFDPPAAMEMAIRQLDLTYRKFHEHHQDNASSKTRGVDIQHAHQTEYVHESDSIEEVTITSGKPFVGMPSARNVLLRLSTPSIKSANILGEVRRA